MATITHSNGGISINDARVPFRVLGLACVTWWLFCGAAWPSGARSYQVGLF